MEEGVSVTVRTVEGTLGREDGITQNTHTTYPYILHHSHHTTNTSRTSYFIVIKSRRWIVQLRVAGRRLLLFAAVFWRTGRSYG